MSKNVLKKFRVKNSKKCVKKFRVKNSKNVLKKFRGKKIIPLTFWLTLTGFY